MTVEVAFSSSVDVVMDFQGSPRKLPSTVWFIHTYQLTLPFVPSPALPFLSHFFSSPHFHSLLYLWHFPHFLSTFLFHSAFFNPPSFPHPQPSAILKGLHAERHSDHIYFSSKCRKVCRAFNVNDKINFHKTVLQAFIPRLLSSDATRARWISEEAHAGKSIGCRWGRVLAWHNYALFVTLF